MMGRETAAFIGLTLLLGACAAPRGQAPPSAVPKKEMAPHSPRDRAEARDQLAYYLAQLESGRRALGLSDDGGPSRESMIAPAVPAPSAGLSGAATRDSAPGSARKSKRARSARAPQERTMAEAPAASGAPSTDDMERAAQRGDVSRCPMACRHARAICRAARHICRLADYLDEDDARIRCGWAQEDCRRAREQTRGQCHACD